MGREFGQIIAWEDNNKKANGTPWVYEAKDTSRGKKTA
jgi:hypothetical protein